MHSHQTLFHSHIQITMQQASQELSRFFAASDKTYSNCMILSNEHLYSLYGAELETVLKAQRISVCVHLVPAGEAAKQMETVMQAWHAMQERGMDRKSVLIALGGGSVSDVAGFVASCYMRGIE